MNHQNSCVWEKLGALGVLSINNPPENFIAEPEFVEKKLLEEIQRDNELKGIIVKGTGRHFSAGADMDNLKELTRNEVLLAKKLTAAKGLIRIIDNLNIPVVAAISGVCFGAGLEIALACHIRICSENALFAFPETNHGIMPGLGGTIMLAKLIGVGRSAEIILTGEIVNAQKALELKLADHSLPARELQAFSMNLLTRMTADRDVEVIHSVMKSIHNSQILSFDKALEEETKLFCALAIKSMQEKEQ
jgi:enoyl-CoA hydratase/carnithine racemase